MGRRCPTCNRIVAPRRCLSGSRILELDVRPADDGTILMLREDGEELGGRVVELGGQHLEDVRSDGTPLYRPHRCET
jgi:hypothetical protein